jgi:hypothetical protein
MVPRPKLVAFFEEMEKLGKHSGKELDVTRPVKWLDQDSEKSNGKGE